MLLMMWIKRQFETWLLISLGNRVQAILIIFSTFWGTMQDYRFLEDIQKMCHFCHPDLSPKFPKRDKKIFEEEELMGNQCAKNYLF